jgi:hypothetical protein
MFDVSIIRSLQAAQAPFRFPANPPDTRKVSRNTRVLRAPDARMVRSVNVRNGCQLAGLRQVASKIAGGVLPERMSQR